MRINELDIFKYTDYRKYLSDIFDHRKSLDKNFTYGKWAKEIGLSSVSGLTMVLKAQRHAGKSIREKLASHLEFNDKESDYFFNLVELQKKAKDDESLVVLMMKGSDKEGEVDSSKRPIHFMWEMGFIREACKWKDFTPSTSFFGHKSRFNISGKDFMDIYQKMIDEKIIKYDNEVVKVNSDYKAQDIDPRFFRYLHYDFLNLAKKSYDMDYAKRALEYRMIMVKKERIEEAKIRINELIQDFIDEFDETESTTKESDIHLLAVNFYPFSK